MTRCLDCGSERIADQCPSCGLTSAAAEVMFRRRLFKRTAVFLAGSLLFPYVSQIYPPLDLDLMLVFFGVLFFVVLAIAVILETHLYRVHSAAVDSCCGIAFEREAGLTKERGLSPHHRG